MSLGLFVLAAAWLGPFSREAAHSFSAHMTVHMSVVAIAAPLLAYGSAGSRFDPARHVESLFVPLLASVVELAVVWAWHTPVLHDLAREFFAAYAIEQATFLVSGFALWIFAFGNRSEQGLARSAAGVVALLLTAIHMTLLGALLGLAPRPLYAAHGGALSALEDQHLGGAIMLTIGGASYLASGLWLSWPLVARSISAKPATSESPERPSKRPILQT